LPSTHCSSFVALTPLQSCGVPAMPTPGVYATLAMEAAMSATPANPFSGFTMEADDAGNAAQK
jgi:hypothetical protein